MPHTHKVAVIVGSLRQDSHTRKLAKALIAEAPANLEASIVEIGDLPLYNEDLETDTPPAVWTRMREEVAAADAVLFVTPEYNRSVPGALKNAIDVGSRPWGEAVFNGKPAAIVAASPGAVGAFGANHHLRQSLVFFDMPVMGQPEAYIGNLFGLFDETGAVASEETKAFLITIMEAFAKWIERTALPASEG